MFFILLFFIYYLMHFTNDTYAKQIKNLVLIAGGQGTITGRTIGDYYESGLTIAFCNGLADIIKRENNNISISIIKASGFYNSIAFGLAEDINKKNADLIIHIGLYAQPEEVPYIHFFYYGHENDPYIKKSTVLQPRWIKIQEAHLVHNEKSFKAVNNASKIIAPYAKQGAYKCSPPKKIPFAPLKGIITPAFACEIGIEKPYDWKGTLNDIAQACIATFKSE